jgi:hypothetical protein
MNDGHEITQVFPDYAKGGLIDRYWHDPKARQENLMEHFRLGVRPYHHIQKEDTDIVLMYAMPWSDINTNYVIEGLQWYTDRKIPIYYICADYEIENTRAGDSVIFKIIRTRHPEIWANIKHIFTCIPFYPEKLKNEFGLENVTYIPTTYDPSYELPIRNVHERDSTLIFGGPISFRHNLFAHMDKLVKSSDRLCHFYNESDKARRNSRAKDPIDVRATYKDSPNVVVYDEPIYMAYPEYLAKLTNSCFAVGDSTFTDLNIGHDVNHHTTRIIDGLYAGCLSLMTETQSIKLYVGNPDQFFIERFDQDDFMAVLSNSIFFDDAVRARREAFNEAFGIDRWYPIFASKLV